MTSRIRRPFEGAREVSVVLPLESVETNIDSEPALTEFRTLLRRERVESEVELGAPVRFVDTDPGTGPRWLIGPATCNPDISRYRRPGDERAGLWHDRQQQVLITDGPDIAGVLEALSLLRTLAMTGQDTLVVADCRNLDEVIQRVVTEVGWTYPAFGLRGLDWAAVCARHQQRVYGATDPLAAFQEWLAELGDAHTWVRASPAPVALPYQLWVDGRTAILTRVPPGTAAWEEGVRVGDLLIGEDTTGWWARTGASPHSRPLVTGRRLLSGPLGAARVFTAQTRDGKVHTWTEAATDDSPTPLVTWHRLESGTGYLRIEAWRADRDVDSAIDAAFRDLRGTHRLIVDLRGNGGGNLVLALSFRDRFLRQRTTLGSIRFSTGTGELSAPEPIAGEPSQGHRRWHGDVRFLTDPLTYSASEDALLGLQGLPHVRIVGEHSGGGSGRPRMLRLLPGYSLTVSTALTFDRKGRCLENAGIAVDYHVAPDRYSPEAPDHVLLAADRTW